MYHFQNKNTTEPLQNRANPFSTTIMSSITTECAADHGGATPIAATLHPEIIQSHILTRLDGSTLASTSCATSQFFSLCSDDDLWRNICNATWPSTTDPRVVKAISAFPSGHRSFYSDSFPAVRHHDLSHRSKFKIDHPPVSDTREFISAVDIFYDEKLIYSKVFATETLSCWFATSPFQLDLLGEKQTVATPSEFGDTCTAAADRLRVSWILIDPVKRRAFNVASQKPVDARRHWLTGEIHKLRYATVVASGGGHVQCAVVVTCGGKESGDLHIKEVSMQVEDMEGKVETGVDSLVILNEAMEGQRRKSDGKLEKDIYELFLKVKVENKERRERRERNLDVLCIATGVSIFVASWVLFFPAS